MSSTGWSSDARNAFGPYVALNSFFGLWPLVRVDLRKKIRITLTAIELIIMGSCVFYEMIQNCGDAEDFLDSLLVIAAAVISLSKLILCYVHRDKLTDIILSSIQDWSSIEAVAYRSLMTSYEHHYKIFTCLYGTAIFSCGLLHCLAVLVFSPTKLIEVSRSSGDFETNVTRFVLKKKYPFPFTCTFNDVSDTYYVTIVCNQLIQTAACCAVIAGSDTIFFAITAHLYGQFEILKIRLANIGSDSNMSTATTSRENVIALISRHQQLLRRMELLEEAYNRIILIQLMMSISVTSAAGFGFVIALKTNDLFASVKSFVVMQSLLLQSFMYTGIGEALQSACYDIMYSVYDGPWYKLPRYLSKDLLFIMIRSSAPTRLTAGKFFDMTRATFTNVVKITFSYISALELMLAE